MKTYFFIALILLIGCSSPQENKKVTNDIVGSWNLVSVDNNFDGIPNGGLTFLSIDYSEMDGYVFSFHEDGRFEQNYIEPEGIDSSFHYEWSLNDSILTTFMITNNSRDTFISGRLSFPSDDQFLLKTEKQTATFNRMK